MGRLSTGLIRRYLARMTGLCRAQVTRLIRLHRKTGRVKAVAYQWTKFAHHYTAGDVELLAYVDKAHGKLSGPATRRILECEYLEYHQPAYQRLGHFDSASVPASQLAGLSQTLPQLSADAAHRHSHPRTPRKGLYHINAVDQVTQWEIVAATQQIMTPRMIGTSL